MTQKAHLFVIKRALADGHSVRVWDSEDQSWMTKRSTKYSEIKSAVEEVEWSNLAIYSQEGDCLGKVAIMFEADQEPEETVCDYTTDEYIDGIMNEYYTNI